MASACLSVRPHPRAKLRSLPRGSPAAGPGTVSPSAKARTGGSADLMNFYATSYALAHGWPRFCPRLGHHTGTGYVSNNHSAISCLLCPRHAAEGHCQDTATSTTAEHFKPFWFPDGRSPLPRHVHQPGSGYLQESSLSCLRTGAVSPQRTWHLQGPPKTSREHGTESCRTGPAQPDVLQTMTIGTAEQSAFTRPAPRSDGVLPALPGQPLGVSVTTTDYLPSARSHGLPTAGHPVPLVSRGLQAPRAPQASPLGQQGAGRKVGGGRHGPGPVGPCTQTASIPQEPSGFTANHVTPRPPLSPAAPARCWWGPTWTARPVGGASSPSGFGTNNHPTGLGDIISRSPAWPPLQSGPR